MNTSKVLSTAASAILFASSWSASAAMMYDVDVTPDVIFGSGVSNGFFTVFQDDFIELGLRAKLRHNDFGLPENTFNSDGAGGYNFAAGVAPGQAFPTAVWSFEWSINTNWAGNADLNLTNFTFMLGLDTDPGLATAFTEFDPINGINPNTGDVRWDHALGTNSTGNGGGVSHDASEFDYISALGLNNVAQNSWKPHWVFGPAFDPTVDATYDIYLAAIDGNGREAGRTQIQVVVGAGGSREVPEPLTIAIFGSGLLAMCGLRRRKTH